jgi:magnesium chelatase family protein
MASRNPGGCPNAGLAQPGLQAHCRLSGEGLALWRQAIQGRRLSARSAERLLRVARSLADLEDRERVEPADLAEALTYRSFDQLQSTEPDKT